MVIIVVLSVSAFMIIDVQEAEDNRLESVVITVEYSGEWSGTYGDLGSMQSWSAIGDLSVTVTRGADDSLWSVAANAQKLDASLEELRISITTVGGTVLETATTTAGYGVASVSYAVMD